MSTIWRGDSGQVGQIGVLQPRVMQIKGFFLTGGNRERVRLETFLGKEFCLQGEHPQLSKSRSLL